MGAQTCLRLAERGQRVLGLERFDIPHTMGASHGVNRIIRLAYFEHPSYVPLLRRAYELWRDLEARAGEQLLHARREPRDHAGYRLRWAAQLGCRRSRTGRRPASTS